MIKSVTYLSEDKKSYELSDESDIQTLDTSVAEGSVARVTGKITAEYELRGGSWVKTAGGSSGGGSVEPLIVRLTAESEYTTMDKTYQEIYDSLFNGTPTYLLRTDVTNSVDLFHIIKCVAGHGYEVHVDVGSDTNIYSARSSDGFPARVGT